MINSPKGQQQQFGLISFLKTKNWKDTNIQISYNIIIFFLLMLITIISFFFVEYKKRRGREIFSLQNFS